MTGSPRRAYRATLAAGFLGLVLTLALAIRALPVLAIEWPSPGELVGACRTLLPAFTVQTAAALALLSLAATVLLLAVRSIVATVAADRAARRLCRTGEVRVIAGQRVVVLPDGLPRAFCVGLVRPVIVLSSGTLARLRPVEVEAVIGHESAHVRRRDPLRVAALGILADALFFLPVVRRLADRHATLAEISADAVAAGRAGRPALARALLLFTEAARPAVGVGIDSQRLDALLDRPSRFTLSAGTILGTSIALVLIGGLAAGGGSTPAGDTARTCVLVLLAVPLLTAVLAFARPRRKEPRFSGSAGRTAPAGPGRRRRGRGPGWPTCGRASAACRGGGDAGRRFRR
jgi:Zn-dependent protease with chaperone function